MLRKHFQKTLLAALISLTLTKAAVGQKEWHAINEGKYNVKYCSQSGSNVIQVVVDSIGLTPALVDGKPLIASVTVFSMLNEKYIPLKNNWAENPLNVTKVLEGRDSNTFYISDDKKMYKASIQNDSVFYSFVFQVFEQFQEIGNICETDDGGVLVPVTLGFKNRIHVLSKDLTLKKTIAIDSNYYLKQVKNLHGHILLSIGGHTGGGGIVELDLETGKTTLIPQTELAGNFNGVELEIIDDALHAFTDPRNKQYSSEGMLFRLNETNHVWIPIVSGIGVMPKKNHRDEWEIYLWDSAIVYPSLEKLGRNGKYKFSGYGIGELLPPYDIREDIRFSEEFYTAFWQRHGGFAAYPSYIIDYGSKTYCFGEHLIAKLGNKINGEVKNLPSYPLSIYPNPSKNEFTISFPSFIGESYKIEIHDHLGKCIFIRNGKVHESNFIKTIGFNNPTGVYYVQVTTNSKNYNGKFLVIE